MSAEAPGLLLRADAGPRIGAGHVMRCLALAQAWRDRSGRAVFVRSEGASWLDDRLTGEGIGVEQVSADPGSADDARQTVACARRFRVDSIVLDGYQFSSRYQQLVREAGFRLLVVDDYGHAEHYWADLVLNQNLYAEAGLYRNREAHARLLLGTRFVLLRREFVSWRGWRRQVPEVGRKVLVTLGGADPANVTLRVVQALRLLRQDDLEAVVLVGAANPYRSELEAAVRDAPALRVCLPSDDMPGLMAWADVAVTAGGTTSWELLFMALPSCMTILADNQAQVVPALEGEGVAYNLGRAADINPSQLATALHELLRDAPRRRAMGDGGRRLVDGLGTDRVIQAILCSREEKKDESGCIGSRHPVLLEQPGGPRSMGGVA